MKYFYCTLLALLCLGFSLSAQTRGDGTQNSPVTIDSAQDWEDFALAIRQTSDGPVVYKDVTIEEYGSGTYFRVTDDIDFSTLGAPFTPVDEFRGNFSGGGHTFTGMTYDSDTHDRTNWGLFIYLNSAVVDSINVYFNEDITVSANSAGVICCSAYGATINDCHVSGAEITCSGSGAGIVCKVEEGSVTITNCSCGASITSSDQAAGICAQSNQAQISNCVNTGDIHGEYNAGGIFCGDFQSGSGKNFVITNCVNTGNVINNNGSSTVGGIVGYFQPTSSGGNGTMTISNCLNIADGLKIIGGTSEYVTINNSANLDIKNGPYFITNIYYQSSSTEKRYNYWDSQMQTRENNEYSNMFNGAENVLATSQMIGTSPSGMHLSTSEWQFEDGLYPIPAGINETDAIRIARIPLLLPYYENSGYGESLSDIRHDFTLPQMSGLTWNYDSYYTGYSTEFFSISGNTANVTMGPNSTDSAHVYLKAQYNGLERRFPLSIRNSLGTSADNPYTIASEDDFTTIAQIINEEGNYYGNFYFGAAGLFFEVSEDIEFGETVTMIGSESVPFRGTFNGGNHIISNIAYDGIDVGLFSRVKGAEIKNINIRDFTIEGRPESFGAICAKAENAQITNCSVYGSLVYSGIGVVDENSVVGGIVGQAIDGTVIDKCISLIQTSEDAGAIAGVVNNSQITNCISDAFVSDGYDNVNLALIANKLLGATVSNCLAIGQNTTYGIAKEIESTTFNNNYFDKQLIPDCENRAGFEGKNTEELINGSLFIDATNWDESIDAYPIPNGFDGDLAVFVKEAMVIAGSDVNSILGINMPNIDSRVSWIIDNPQLSYADNVVTVPCLEEIINTQITKSYNLYSQSRDISAIKGVGKIIQTPSSVCSGETVMLEVVGGDSYLWSNSATTSSISMEIPLVLESTWGGEEFSEEPILEMSVQVADAECGNRTLNHTLSVIDRGVYEIYGLNPVCQGSEVTLSVESSKGDNFHVEWHLPDGGFANGNEVHIGAMSSDLAGTYSGIITNDETGCKSTFSGELSVNNSSSLTLISGSENQLFCNNGFAEEIVYQMGYPASSLRNDGHFVYDYDAVAGLLKVNAYVNVEDDDLFTTVATCTQTRNINLSKEGAGVTTYYAQNAGLSGDPIQYFERVEEYSEIYLKADHGSIKLEWEGTEDVNTPPAGMYLVQGADTIHILGAPSEYGEYYFRASIAGETACGKALEGIIAYYEGARIVASDSVICTGDSISLDVIVRESELPNVKTQYEYSWINETDEETIGNSKRIYVNPQETTSYQCRVIQSQSFESLYDGYLSEIDIYPYYSYFNGGDGEFAPGKLIVMEHDEDSVNMIFNYCQVAWSFAINNLPLTNYPTATEAATDMNGIANSAVMASYVIYEQEDGGDPDNPITDFEEVSSMIKKLASAEDFMYLPSAGEMIQFYKKGLLFPLVKAAEEFNTVVYVWTSTQKDEDEAYALNLVSGELVPLSKTLTNMTAVAVLHYGRNDFWHDVMAVQYEYVAGEDGIPAIEIGVSQPFEANITYSNRLCDVEYATVSAEASIPDVTYQWYNITTDEIVSTNQEAQNLPQGNYVLTVFDSENACKDTVMFRIVNLQNPLPSDTVACLNSTLDINLEYENVEYLWSTGETTASVMLFPTEATTYTLTITAPEGCTVEGTMNVTMAYPTESNVTESMCNGTIFLYNGHEFTNTGTYDVHLTNVAGCDSLVHLTIIPSQTCEGILAGRITDGSNAPIQGARVLVGDAMGETDAEGNYSFEMRFGYQPIRVSAIGYNPIQVYMNINSDTTFSCSLEAPQMDFSISNIELNLYPNENSTDTIVIINNGSGDLVWSSLVGCDPELYDEDQMRSRGTRSLWGIGNYINTENRAEQALATDGFYIYTASWMRTGQISKYSADNGFIETFKIDGVGKIRNLVYDGNRYFYASDASNILYKIDMNARTLVETVQTQVPTIRHIAYNKNNSTLLVGDWSTLYEISPDGNIVNTISASLSNVYGTAYDNLSVGGPYLWIFSQNSQGSGPSATISQFSLSTNQFTGVTHYMDDFVGMSNSNIAGGLCVSETYFKDRFVLMANIQRSTQNNLIVVYELARKSTWLNLDSKGGVVAPGSSQKVVVSANLRAEGSYTADLSFLAAIPGAQPQIITVSAEVRPLTCTPVENFVAVTDTFHPAYLSWDAYNPGVGIVSYIVYDASRNSVVDTVTTPECIINNLHAGEHCYYIRTLVDASVDCISEPSDTLCVSIINFPCEEVVTVTARSNSNAIQVSWNPVFGVESYDLYRNEELISPMITDTIYLDEDVNINTQYCYKIVTIYVNNECNPKESETFCAMISDDLCSNAPVLSYDTLFNNVILMWTPSISAYAYNVHRNGIIVRSNLNDTVFVDTDLSGGEYCYTIEALCNFGVYNDSEPLCVTITGINSQYSKSISIYPNPAESMFMITGEGIAEVEMFNSLGQIVRNIESADDYGIDVDVSDLPRGVYTLRLVNRNNEIAIKQVVLR